MTHVVINGGMSVISAFFNGIGSAVALDLPMTVEVIGHSSASSENKDPTINGILKFYQKSLDVTGSFAVSVESRIPKGYGLKSSSALAFGILEGLAAETGINIDPHGKCVLAARASLDVGISKTGSFDDILASCYGGVSLADNLRFSEIYHSTVSSAQVIIAYRDGVARYSASVNIDQNAVDDRMISRMAELVKEGNFLSAAVMNSNMMRDFYPIDQEIANAFILSGACFWGQSGKGPAVFGSFCDDDSKKKCLKALSQIPGAKVINTATSNLGARVIS